MSPALEIVRVAKGKLAPTSFKVIIPAPAAKVIGLAMPKLSKFVAKLMAPPAVVIVAVPAVNVTSLENVTAALTVVMFTPRICALLATVSPLVNVEVDANAPLKITAGVTAVVAERVVSPDTEPVTIAAFTVKVAFVAVILRAVAVIRASSIFVRLKPPVADPKVTTTPVLLVMLTTPAAALIAA